MSGWRVWLGATLACAALAYAVLALWPDAAPAASITSKPGNAQPLVVQEVLSGDTVVLSAPSPGSQVPSWGTVTARLLGVDAPNLGILPECFAVEARARLMELLPKGSLAWGTVDEAPQDPEGRWLMYLWTTDGRFVNFELTVDGLVAASDMPPNEERWKVIAAGQTQAVARQWGIWGECGH